MAILLPTLREILARTRADFETELGQYPIPGTVEDHLARFVASASHGLHAHLAAEAVRVLVDKCDDPTLARWARLLGVPPRPGNAASGEATFAAPSDDTIPAGATAKAGAVAFRVLSSSSTGGTCTAEIEALDTGADGNIDAGEAIRLDSPIAGVASEGVIAAGGTTGGTEAETIDSLRARVLYRFAHPRRGGAAGDFVAWALEVPGVLAAWEYPERTSARVVDVLFVMEPSGSDVWAIPSGSEVATVQAYLDERAPSTMTVDVIAPVDDGRSLAIAVTPNTAAVQAAVVERVKAMFLRVAEPGGTITLSQISAAVSEAVGETDHSITSPASDLSSTGDDLLSYDGIMFT